MHHDYACHNRKHMKCANTCMTWQYMRGCARARPRYVQSKLEARVSPSVRSTMGGETAAGGKALTALVAAEGFLARVRPTMAGETAAG